MAKATASRQMKWDAANPTTFVYQTEKGKIILQKVPRKQPVPGVAIPRTLIDYLLQATNPGGRVEFAITGRTDAEINSQLGAVYETIVNTNQEIGLEFFKSLLP